MKSFGTTLAAVAALVVAAPAGAYPIDAFPDTGIARLEAYRLVQEGEMQGSTLPWGAQLFTKEIKLRLAEYPAFEVPAADPAFTAQIVDELGPQAASYGIAVIDVSDPANPKYAAHNADQIQNPGSVGKILVGLAWFQLLADVYPDDVEARKRVLRETQVTADAFIRSDTHDVPFWRPGQAGYVKRPIEEGDTANLWTWLDWMLSASSNAAAAQLQAQLVLFAHFRERYPVSADETRAFWKSTPAAELGRLYSETMTRALVKNGLRPTELQQGTLFTREGKQRIPGGASRASASELLHYMLLLEQGRLVDRWSSLELKKLLYLTDSRIRYASSPVLYDWAVYFKSGSFYSCRPEPGFSCEKYAGNRVNYMNSVTMVENVDQKQKVHYIAAVLSNVLRENSEGVHRAMGERIHALVLARHPERSAPDAAVGAPAPGTAPAPEAAPAAPPEEPEAAQAGGGEEEKPKRGFFKRIIGGD
jgi:hypothetical protein